MQEKERLKKTLLNALKTSHNEAISQKPESGQYIKEGYSGDISTQADLNIEKAIIQSFMSSGIKAKITSEEKGTTTINTKDMPDYLITIDPLDGSSNFSHGKGLMPYATTIAIFKTTKKPLFKDIICAGTTEHTQNNTWIAIKDEGTTLNNSPCTPSKKTTIDQKGKYITDMFYKINWITFNKLIKGKEKININDYGSAALHYAMLSSGHIDAMMSASQKAHELAAGYLLAKESGAILADLKGNPIDDIEYDFNSKYPIIAAATEELHKEILNTINK